MLFDVTAYQNPYLRPSQRGMQAVLSLQVGDTGDDVRALLALALVIDRSASMDGQKMNAAREAARRVINAADESVLVTVVAFNEKAQLLVPPALCTTAAKRTMLAAIDSLHATGGTCMSTGLTMAIDKLSDTPNRARHILFLTDGKNEGEKHASLERAVARCRDRQFQITAWGVGTSWDARELRYIADETLGTADIIPAADQVGTVFAAAFSQLQRIAASEVRLCLWLPVGASLRAVRQVHPDLLPLRVYPDAASPRLFHVPVGSLIRGERREYLLDLDLPAYEPGQQYLVVRPSVLYSTPSSTAVEEKTERKAWIFASPTTDLEQASRVDPYVAHYVNQEALAVAVRDGQDALAQGDRARATRLLGEALTLSQQAGNAPVTRLLEEMVRVDPNGTVRLNETAGALQRKTLALRATRTSRLS